jgi:NADP-dependent 3-hydroxy acid dehydrogenase YdfG
MKKLVVITGASSGIGEAIARRLSDAGHPLLLLARRVEKLEALELPNTMCEKVDITDKATFEAAIQKAEVAFGPADALINNAGVMLLGQINTQDASEWKTMFDVNVLGLLNGMQAVLAPMKARNSGTIINISSIAGRKTFGNHAASECVYSRNRSSANTSAALRAYLPLAMLSSIAFFMIIFQPLQPFQSKESRLKSSK